VIGFLCNVLGIDDQEKPEYEKLLRIKISIAGRFESKTTEYIWFRNLSKDAHVARFGSVENRSIGGHIEHIGGQSPISIDVLNEVRLTLYLAHEIRDFLEIVRSSLENPTRRLEVLHLGRAEDWIVLEEISNIEEISKFGVMRRDGNYSHFFWIPERIWMLDTPNGKKPYDSFEGLLYRVPSFWTVADYERTRNRHEQRIFEYMPAKLNDGLLVGGSFLYDESANLPIFLADFGSTQVNV
jgi:CRISPR-associated protein Cas5t